MIDVSAPIDFLQSIGDFLWIHASQSFAAVPKNALGIALIGMAVWTYFLKKKPTPKKPKTAKA